MWQSYCTDNCEPTAGCDKDAVKNAWKEIFYFSKINKFQQASKSIKLQELGAGLKGLEWHGLKVWGVIFGGGLEGNGGGGGAGQQPQK